MKKGNANAANQHRMGQPARAAVAGSEREMKTCIGCKYASWRRTANGRLHPSGDGECTYEVKMPVLPVSRCFIGGPPEPHGGFIDRKREHKDHCECYVPESNK